MEKKLKTKNTKNTKSTKNNKAMISVDKESVIDETSVNKPSDEAGIYTDKSLRKDRNQGLLQFHQSSYLIWFSITFLTISLLATSSYFYFSNQRLLKALDKALLEQERISSLFIEEELSKSTKKQFDKMYLDMITPDLERKTLVFEEKLNEFRNELGAKLPTIDNIIKEVQPLLRNSLIEIENKLSVQVSDKIDNLKNLTKELSDDLSSSGEMNIDLIKEIDNFNEEISKLKSANQDIQKQMTQNSYEQKQLDERLSKINSTPKIVYKKTNSETLYSEVQEILNILPGLTISAIREEYILKTHKETRGSLWGRLRAFVGSRVISRSLQPQEGKSVDAIMSRVEYSLRQLDLVNSLVELEALPENTSYIFYDLVKRIENLIEDPRVILQQEK